jgi:hypothetical protein
MESDYGERVAKHMTERFYRILILVLLVLILSLQVVLLYRQSSNVTPSDVHTLVLNWPFQQIAANTVVSGYVGNWTGIIGFCQTI